MKQTFHEIEIVEELEHLKSMIQLYITDRKAGRNDSVALNTIRTSYKQLERLLEDEKTV